MKKRIDGVFLVRLALQVPVSALGVGLFIYYSPTFPTGKYLFILLSGCLGFVLLQGLLRTFAAAALAFLILFILGAVAPNGPSFYVFTALPEMAAFVAAGYLIALSVSKIMKKTERLKYAAVALALLLSTSAAIATNIPDLGTNACIACEYSLVKYGNLTLRFDRIDFCGPLDYYIATFRTPEGKAFAIPIEYYQYHKTSVL